MDDRRLVDRLRLVVVTPGSGDASSVLDTLDRALDGGVTSVWLRERQRLEAELIDLATQVRALTERFGAAAWLAGRADLAAELGFDAVHLGFADAKPAALAGPRPPAVGWSAHDPLDLTAIAGADYVTLSPLHPTPAKGGRARAPIGVERFAECVAQIDVPVVALGGVDGGNARAAVEAGAVGVCVMRAITDADDPRAAAAALRAAVTETP